MSEKKIFDEKTVIAILCDYNGKGSKSNMFDHVVEDGLFGFDPEDIDKENQTLKLGNAFLVFCVRDSLDNFKFDFLMDIREGYHKEFRLQYSDDVPSLNIYFFEKLVKHP